MIQAVAAKLVQSELSALVAQLDEEGDQTVFLVTLKKLAELGFRGLNTERREAATKLLAYLLVTLKKLAELGFMGLNIERR